MPLKKPTIPTRERRYIPVTNSGFQLRKGAEGKPTQIIGYAAKFIPAFSQDLDGWIEELHPNCFDSCLASNPDVRALWNHDANHVLGRTKSGTLRLSADATGLRYVIDAPDTQFARDLMVSIDRGDVTQSSFGFIANRDSWRDDPKLGIVRTVLEAELFDVSPVTFPAYLDATSGVRAALRSAPAPIREKLKRNWADDDPDCDPDSDDPDNDCPDDRDSNEDFTTDEDDFDDGLSSEDRCAYRCAAHRSVDSPANTITEDDPFDIEARCQFRCGRCADCRSSHTNVSEDDPAARYANTATERAHLDLLLRRLR